MMVIMMVMMMVMMKMIMIILMMLMMTMIIIMMMVMMKLIMMITMVTMMIYNINNNDDFNGDDNRYDECSHDRDSPLSKSDTVHMKVIHHKWRCRYLKNKSKVSSCCHQSLFIRRLSLILQVI